MAEAAALFPLAVGETGCHARPMRDYFVYILASKPHGTLYVGVT